MREEHSLSDDLYNESIYGYFGTAKFRERARMVFGSPEAALGCDQKLEDRLDCSLEDFTNFLKKIADDDGIAYVPIGGMECVALDVFDSISPDEALKLRQEKREHKTPDVRRPLYGLDRLAGACDGSLVVDMADSRWRTIELAAGAFGSEVRALHADNDENVFDGALPVIINGAPSLADRPDLNERTILVRSLAIQENKCKRVNASRKMKRERRRQWAAEK
jgi:hypothetical protein